MEMSPNGQTKMVMLQSQQIRDLTEVALALALTALVSYLYISNRTVPDGLLTLWGGVIGFYFRGPTQPATGLLPPKTGG